jgi:uncharacterized protein (TIGR03083 family)
MLRRVSTGDTAVDVAAARNALGRTAEKLCAVIASAADAGASVPGSDWSVGEVAAHVALISEFYTGYALGGVEPFVDVSDVAGGSVARTSAARLDAEPERDPAALVLRLKAGTSSLLEATSGRPSDDAVTWNGRPLDLGALVGIALGEYLLHGLDLAKALSRPWKIEADDARIVLASTVPLLSMLVDPRATAGVSTTYDLRVRGGARYYLGIRHGVLTVGGAGDTVDCHVSADPVALLLVAYGRRSQWIPALTEGWLPGDEGRGSACASPITSSLPRLPWREECSIW